MVKNPPANASCTRDTDLIPGPGRYPGEGNGNPLQYYCLENSMDRGAWQATVHGVAESRTQLSIAQYFSLCGLISFKPFQLLMVTGYCSPHLSDKKTN